MEPIDLDKRHNLKTQTDFLMKMVKGCKSICLDFKSADDLNLTEKNCLDRCSAKYMIVGDYVSKHYHKELNSK